jgi:hypothetical protein
MVSSDDGYIKLKKSLYAVWVMGMSCTEIFSGSVIYGEDPDNGPEKKDRNDSAYI